MQILKKLDVHQTKEEVIQLILEQIKLTNFI